MSSDERPSPGPDVPRVPEKARFYVREVAALLAPILERSVDSTTSRIYRRIQYGEIRSIRYLGTIMIPRDEVLRLVAGNPDD